MLQVCDADTGLYADPRQSICVTNQCGYDLGDCVHATASAVTAATGIVSVGYVSGPQFQVVTNATVMPTGLPTMTPAGQSINANDADLILDSGLASVYSRWAAAYNWNMVRLLMLVSHLTHLTRLMLSSFLFVLYFFSF